MTMKSNIVVNFHEPSGKWELSWATPTKFGHSIDRPFFAADTRQEALGKRREVYDETGMYPHRDHSKTTDEARSVYRRNKERKALRVSVVKTAKEIIQTRGMCIADAVAEARRMIESERTDGTR